MQIIGLESVCWVIWLGIQTYRGCEHDNENYVSVKGEEFLIR